MTAESLPSGIDFRVIRWNAEGILDAEQLAELVEQRQSEAGVGT